MRDLFESCGDPVKNALVILIRLSDDRLFLQRATLDLQLSFCRQQLYLLLLQPLLRILQLEIALL